MPSDNQDETGAISVAVVAAVVVVVVRGRRYVLVGDGVGTAVGTRWWYVRDSAHRNILMVGTPGQGSVQHILVGEGVGTAVGAAVGAVGARVGEVVGE